MTKIENTYNSRAPQKGETDLAGSNADRSPKVSRGTNRRVRTAVQKATEAAQRKIARASDAARGITRLDWRVWAKDVPALQKIAQQNGWFATTRMQIEKEKVGAFTAPITTPVGVESTAASQSPKPHVAPDVTTGREKTEPTGRASNNQPEPKNESNAETAARADEPTGREAISSSSSDRQKLPKGRRPKRPGNTDQQNEFKFSI